MRTKFIKGKVSFESVLKVTHADKEPTNARYMEGEFYVYETDGKTYADIGWVHRKDHNQRVILPIKEKFDDLEECKEDSQ